MDDGVSRIDLGFVNAYLLRGASGHVLVDCGLAMQWETLKGKLEAAGCPPAELKLLFLTHGDQDHAGNAARLQREFGVAVAAHRAEAEILRTGMPPKRRISGFKSRALFAVMDLLRRLSGGGSTFPTFEPDLLPAGREGPRQQERMSFLLGSGTQPACMAISYREAFRRKPELSGRWPAPVSWLRPSRALYHRRSP